MADRRPYLIVTVIVVASLTVGAASLFQAYRMRQAATSANSDEGYSGVALKPSAATKLPAGTELLAPAEDGEIRGIVMCGRCIWGIGDSCNVLIWDKKGQHVAVVLPNEQLKRMERLTGDG